MSWHEWLTLRLAELLGDEVVAAAVVVDPSRDLFEAGLDSLRCFRLLDDLADAGVEIDFTDLVASPTAGFVLAQTAASGVSAP